MTVRRFSTIKVFVAKEKLKSFVCMHTIWTKSCALIKTDWLRQIYTSLADTKFHGTDLIVEPSPYWKMKKNDRKIPKNVLFWLISSVKERLLNKLFTNKWFAIRFVLKICYSRCLMSQLTIVIAVCHQNWKLNIFHIFLRDSTQTKKKTNSLF